jgi:hypothetical protein
MQLTASVLLAPGAALSPSVQALRAPAGYAMLVDEIKMEVAALSSDVGADSQIPGIESAGMLAGAQFKLKQAGKDDVLLSAGMVPIAMFAPSVQTQAEHIDSSSFIPSTASESRSQYSWFPKSPIYIPAGALLEPTFENRGFLNISLRVRVSYSVRIIPANAPALCRIPYVMAWQSSMFNADGTEVESDSTEKDLANPFDGPIEIERVIGRVVEVLAIVGYSPPIRVIEGNAGQHAAPTGYAFVLNQTKLQLTASWGTRFIQDWIPWAAAFDMWTRSIPATHEMPPKSHYMVQIKGGGESVTDVQFFACVSMVGSREVVL